MDNIKCNKKRQKSLLLAKFYECNYFCSLSAYFFFSSLSLGFYRNENEKKKKLKIEMKLINYK